MQINWYDFFDALTKYSSTSSKTPTLDLTIDKAVNIYLDKVKAELSFATYKMNFQHLHYVKKFYENNNIFLLSQLTPIQIEEYIIISHSNKKSNATINKEIQLLRRVIKYCKKLNLYNGDIFEYHKLKETYHESRYLTLEELDRINKNIQDLNFQNQVIILLLMNTGIRRTELTNILIENIDFNNNLIFLNKTKTNKPRNIYFNIELRPALIELSKKNKKFLFENQNHDQITADSISSVLKRLGKKINIPDLSTHKFRHSYATYLIKSNVNIREVQELMGHTNLNTTMRYLHNDKKDIANHSKSFNPLSLITQKKH